MGQPYVAPAWHRWISSVAWWITCSWPGVLVVMNLSKTTWGPTRVIGWLLSAERRHRLAVLWQNISTKTAFFFFIFLHKQVSYSGGKCWKAWLLGWIKIKIKLWSSIKVSQKHGNVLVLIILIVFCLIVQRSTSLSAISNTGNVPSALKPLFTFAKNVTCCGRNFKCLLITVFPVQILFLRYSLFTDKWVVHPFDRKASNCKHRSNLSSFM